MVTALTLCGTFQFRRTSVALPMMQKCNIWRIGCSICLTACRSTPVQLKAGLQLSKLRFPSQRQLQDQPEEDRFASLEEAVRSEIDTLAEEVRCQKQTLETSLETELGNCLAGQNSLLSADEETRKRWFAVEDSVKQGFGSLAGRLNAAESSVSSLQENDVQRELVFADFKSKCEAKMAATDEAQRRVQQAHASLEGQMSKDHDRLLVLENILAQLKETVRAQNDSISRCVQQLASLKSCFAAAFTNCFEVVRKHFNVSFSSFRCFPCFAN